MQGPQTNFCGDIAVSTSQKSHISSHHFITFPKVIVFCDTWCGPLVLALSCNFPLLLSPTYPYTDSGSNLKQLCGRSWINSHPFSRFHLGLSTHHIFQEGIGEVRMEMPRRRSLGPSRKPSAPWARFGTEMPWRPTSLCAAASDVSDQPVT